MKSYAKFSFLLAIDMLSGCRSHKATEESVYLASDSCKAETALNVQSLTNIVATESVDSNYLQDYFDFEDGAGVIHINTDGAVTIKGLKSASLIRTSNQKTADIQILESDTLSAQSHSESNSAIATAIKTRKDTLNSNSNWLKYLLLVIILLLGLLLSLKRIKASLKQ